MAGEGDGAADVKALGESVKKLESALTGLVNVVKAQQTSQTSMTKQIEGLVELSKNRGKSETESEDDDSEEVDFESLNNAQLVKLVVGEVGKVLDEKVKSLDEKIGKVVTDSTTSKRREEIEKFASAPEHKDFWDWGDEVKKMASNHPSLSIAQIYTLVREANPEKVKELKVKYDDKKDGDGEAKQKFLGLTPTSHTTSSKKSEGIAGEKKGQKASAHDAASAAFDKIMADLPQGTTLLTEDSTIDRPQTQ